MSAKKTKSTQKPLTSFFFSKTKEAQVASPAQQTSAGKSCQQTAVKKRREPRSNAEACEVINIEDSPPAPASASRETSGRSPPGDAEDQRPAKRAKVSPGDGASERNTGRADSGSKSAGGPSRPLPESGSTAKIPEHSDERHNRFQAKLIDGRPARWKQGSEAIVPQKFTPLESQVAKLKEDNPGVLLIVEVGYKFRFFGKDAETAASVCNIFCYPDRNYMTASIPVPRLHAYVRRLVAAGHKVGIVRQVETAALKSQGDNKYAPFERKLTAMYTRSTLEAGGVEDIGPVEEQGASESPLSNFLVCLVEEGVGPKEEGDEVEIGIVAVETSNGDILYSQFRDNMMRGNLEGHLLFATPSELLMAEPLSPATRRLLGSFSQSRRGLEAETVVGAKYGTEGARTALTTFFESVESPDDAVVEGVRGLPPLVVQALAHALNFLRSFKLEAVLAQSCAFRPFSQANEISLSPNALRQLEVLRNSDDGGVKGSLLWLLDHTRTAMGRRLLKGWVTHPLRNVPHIQERLDAVEELSQAEDDEATLLGKLRTCLGGLPDLERSVTRILHKTASPSELLTTLKAFKNVSTALEAKGKVEAPLLERHLAAAVTPEVGEAASQMLSYIHQAAAEQNDKMGLIKSRERFPELAACREDEEQARSELAGLLPKLAKRLGVGRLEYKSLMNQGDFLIEVDAARTDIPKDWEKVSAVKKFNRFRPPEVAQANKQLDVAKERLQAAADAAYLQLLGSFSALYLPFRSAATALASLDALQSLALVANYSGYTRPEFVPADEPAQLSIAGGRHPVLDALLDSYVPNDTCLGGSAANPRVQICTGPNMGGKSSYIRQVALLCIMAQVGSFVPADSMRLRAIDAVHTRMGASDNLAQGRSTFLEELSETSTILATATESSLVVVDELGRGTSTQDGVAIAHATLQYLTQQLKPLTLFVTHYPQVASLRASFPNEVEARYMSFLTNVEEAGDGAAPEVPKITFLHKLVPGVADRSFGLNVARMAALPESVIACAARKAAEMEHAETARQRSKELPVLNELRGLGKALKKGATHAELVQYQRSVEVATPS